jgi:hypothetical protein
MYDRRLRRLAPMLLTVTLGAAAPAAHAAPTPEARVAAQAGARWIAAQQAPDGRVPGFGGDWAVSALAATGVHAADVRTGPSAPSLQDAVLGAWTELGSGPSVTSYARDVLIGEAGGLQPSRIGVGQNFVAALVAGYDGRHLDGAASVNGQAFGILALRAAGVPATALRTLADGLREQQAADGGWSFAAPSARGDVDMTGAAVAALCAAGATADDPLVSEGLAYLRAAHDPATGGIASPFFGVNTDSTAWAVSGLNACGVDPGSWDAAQGADPVDFLIAQQNPDGSFQWRTGDGAKNLYSTQSAVRALAGFAFTAPAPARADGTSPVQRSVAEPPAGTPVPMTLVIDGGEELSGGRTVRMCAVSAPAGTTLGGLLAAARVGSAPLDCVADFAVDDGRLSRINGIAAVPGTSAWTIRRDGDAPDIDATAPLGLGSTVVLELTGDAGAAPPLELAGDAGAAPAVESPRGEQPPAPTPLPQHAPAALRILVGPVMRVRHGAVRVRVACPVDAVEGCRGAVRLRMTLRDRAGRLVRRTVARGTVELPAGRTTSVRLRLGKAARRALRERPGRIARLRAAVRDGDGALAVSRAQTVLR